MSEDERPPVVQAALSEDEGCALLKRWFEGAGYAIAEDVPFQVGDATVELDGYDAEASVGYEYITTSAGDRAEFTPEVMGALEARMRSGDLFLFLIDERRVDAAGLELAAKRFLEHVGRARGGDA